MATVLEKLEAYKKRIRDANTYRGRVNNEGEIRSAVADECARIVQETDSQALALLKTFFDAAPDPTGFPPHYYDAWAQVERFLGGKSEP
jgi:hypothetical protein